MISAMDEQQELWNDDIPPFDNAFGLNEFYIVFCFKYKENHIEMELVSARNRVEAVKMSSYFEDYLDGCFLFQYDSMCACAWEENAHVIGAYTEEEFSESQIEEHFRAHWSTEQDEMTVYWI